MAMMKHLLEAEATDDDFDIDTSSSEEEWILQFLWSSSSSDDDENLINFKKRRTVHKIQGYMEVVQAYDEMEFKEHFRLTRRSASVIIDRVSRDQVLPYHLYGRKKIDPEKAVLMTIWYLSNTETFRQIADRFGVTRSSAHRIITKVVKYLVSVSKEFIRWPDNRRCSVIQTSFREKHGIDKVIGAIDGCHINIKRPAKDAYVYCNRKSDHSILLQAICDHEKKFLDFFCGEAGSIHDARLLKRSSIYEKGLNGFFGNSVLLGDSAYPCLNWLIPPFRDNGHLTRNQRTFNYRHSSTRVIIENAFGLLKGRFRRLKGFENANIKLIVQCVVAAGVLHNICLDCDDEIEYEVENMDSDEPEDEQFIYNICGIPANDQRRNELFFAMFNREE